MWIAIAEHDSGVLTEGTRELLTFLRAHTDEDGAPLEVAVLGQAGADAATELAGWGVARVHVVTHTLCDAYVPEAWGAALAQLVTASSPAAVVAPGSARGNEVLAHVAARLDAPLATACTTVQPAGDVWRVTRLRWGGVLLEEAELDAPVKLVTVAPHAVTAGAPATPTQPASVIPFVPDLDDTLGRTRVVDRVAAGGGVTLTTAPIVVSGGRGVGSAEGFAVLTELAELVGGAVGCSRVATSNGWRSHTDQVGQTGAVVAPDLYIACGISGATQHWVGCKNAKRILAINTDGQAPMVTRADYAVVGDLHQVLSAVVAELRARRDATVRTPA